MLTAVKGQRRMKWDGLTTGRDDRTATGSCSRARYRGPRGMKTFTAWLPGVDDTCRFDLRLVWTRQSSKLYAFEQSIIALRSLCMQSADTCVVLCAKFSFIWVPQCTKKSRHQHGMIDLLHNHRVAIIASWTS